MLMITGMKEDLTMDKRVIPFLMVLFMIPGSLFAAQVDGYWRDSNRDGVKDTYVQPHQRSNPNSSRTDNYSYPGNYNPNSGEFTRQSNSPRETYPSNPSPYERKKGW